MILVSVDGGCDAVKDGVRPGVIDATVAAVPGEHGAARASTPSPTRRAAAASRPGYKNTGVELITGDAGERRALQGRGLRRAQLLGLTVAR